MALHSAVLGGNPNLENLLRNRPLLVIEYTIESFSSLGDEPSRETLIKLSAFHSRSS